MDILPDVMTEEQYRALDYDSYSSIKIFIEDRKKYYRKFVLKEPVKEPDTQSIAFGSLVDCLRLSPEQFDDKFAISITDIPTGQYGKLIKELMKVTQENVNEQGEVTKDVENMLEEAYNRVKYDRNGSVVDFKRDSLETVKNKFVGSDLEVYYRYLRQSYGKTVVEPSLVTQAQEVAAELSTNFVTSEVINLENSEKVDVYNQFAVITDIGKNLEDGILEHGEVYIVKGLIDKLVIDHESEKVFIYELKTIWDNEGEFLSNYLKYKYYIQAALYFYLVVEWISKQENLKDYKVQYPCFIAADSHNYKNPLLYTTDIENFRQGMKGFTIRGRYYPGIIKALSDIVWHKSKGIWNISRENYTNRGIVKIRPFQN